VGDVPRRDLVGLRICNTDKVEDNVVGVSLRRRYQLKPDVLWAVLWKVMPSNSRFGPSECLEVHLDHVTIPAGNGKGAGKTKGTPIGCDECY